MPLYKPDIIDLTVSFKTINFSLQIFLLFVPDMSTGFMLHTVYIIYWLHVAHCLYYLLASCCTLFILSTFLCFGSCNHCILACFLRSKNHKHSSTNYGFYCFSAYRPRLSLAEVLIISLVFTKALFMS